MREIAKKILIKLCFVQVAKLEEGMEGKDLYRFNPWNPLVYLVILVDCLVTLILHGVVGLWRFIKSSRNLFKWWWL